MSDIRIMVLSRSKGFVLRLAELEGYDINRNYYFYEQALHCGASVGLYITEAEYTKDNDVIYGKYVAALEAAVQTKYWLTLLRASWKSSDDPEFDIIRTARKDCDEIIKLLEEITEKGPDGNEN